MSTSDNTPETITIQLTQGYSTVIDAIDGDLVQFKWYAQKQSDDLFRVQRNATYSGSKTRTTVLLHRVILERMLMRPIVRKELVDHIDGNPLNNRRSNLRLAFQGQNRANSRISRNNKSGYKGVYWRKDMKTWRAQIRKDKVIIHLGYFNTPEEAHQAYCEAAVKYHGEFARFK